MGGDIGVSSTENQGSEFWFTIPLIRQSGDQQLSQFRPNLQGLHACLVESNDTVRFLVQHYAESWGMACTMASDGGQALELLRQSATEKPYDLIIVDQELSDMNGLEFARSVKTDPAFTHVRLVMLSSIARRGDARKAQEAGFVAYLTKPVRQEQLYRCLTLAMASETPGPSPDQEELPTLITRHTLEEIAKRSRTRILLAEDNIVNQKVAKKMLDKLGFRTDIVGNGREAIEALNRIPYDLILMDCQMPEMDGWEATKEIRRREAEKREE